MRRHTGFTLIELMIVVVIIGVIAGMAFPTYKQSVRNSKRAAATTSLVELAQWLERRYSLTNTYLDGMAAPALPFTTEPRDGGGDVSYNFSFSGNPTATTFTLQAQPVGSQADDRCGTLTLDQAGVRNAAEADCW